MTENNLPLGAKIIGWIGLVIGVGLAIKGIWFVISSLISFFSKDSESFMGGLGLILGIAEIMIAYLIIKFTRKYR